MFKKNEQQLSFDGIIRVCWCTAAFVEFVLDLALFSFLCTRVY